MKKILGKSEAYPGIDWADAAPLMCSVIASTENAYVVQKHVDALRADSNAIKLRELKAKEQK